jgi:cold shock CspA family protein/ribosome-associated translation inhibitor RaiA
METPVEIDYLGGKPPEPVRQLIESNIAALEKRFGRITACRVAVEAPSGRHRTGGLHQVRIHLALPNGKTVDVDRVADDDERLADAGFAVNDAFKRARRRLEDQVRRMRGDVKAHEPEPLGTVVSIDTSGDFGFLQAPDGREVYFHRNSVLNDAFASLKVGTRVAFFEETGDKGPQASTVKIAGKHGLR